MVILTLIGGLGNQLSGYAFGYAMAKRMDTELYLDDSLLKKLEKKNNIENLYGLGHFDISLPKSKKLKNEVIIFLYNSLLGKIYRKIYEFIPFRLKNIIIETDFRLNLEILQMNKKSAYFLYGYWPAFNYWSEFKDEVLSNIKFSDLIENSFFKSKKKIEKTNSVSVHIRRGDYEKKPDVNNTLGNVCSINYYRKSYDFIYSKVKNPQFIVFSDDIEWAKENFKIDGNEIYVDEHSNNDDNEVGHKNDGQNDLYLMSLCKHNILANSSFSLWAALLNKNSSKIVVCPSKWFNPKNSNLDKINNEYINTIFPDEWIKINIS
jgi:hypothetical protein